MPQSTAQLTTIYQRDGQTFVFRYNATDRDRRQVIMWAGLMAQDPENPLTWSDFETIANGMLSKMQNAELPNLLPTPSADPTIRT